VSSPHEAAGALNEALYDGDYDPDERATLVGNHRAEVLREAAALAALRMPVDVLPEMQQAWRAGRDAAVALLIRMACGEEPETSTTPSDT
jgi:hypothetical protein